MTASPVVRKGKIIFFLYTCYANGNKVVIMLEFFFYLLFLDL